MKPLKIALLSTCAVSVPPRAYGGTELITYELAKQLTHLGHDVTLYATGDSRVEGVEVRSCFDAPVWPPNDLAELRHASFAFRDVIASPHRFDVIHAHQAQALPLAAMCSVPIVLTMHHKRIESLVDYYEDFPHAAFVAISRRQAELVPELDVEFVVHHGLDSDLYPEGGGGGGYAAFLGRLAQEKAPHVAIDAATEAGVPLRIGGKAHWENEEYFEREVRTRLERPAIEWLGELSHEPKVELLSNASALLFPIDWEEPFGLVMIESMLVGTPVIAFARGAAPEVIEEGVTGFIVRDAHEMSLRLNEVHALDRGRCRERARERWSSVRMVREYEQIYERLVTESRAARPRTKSDPQLKTG